MFATSYIVLVSVKPKWLRQQRCFQSPSSLSCCCQQEENILTMGVSCMHHFISWGCQFKFTNTKLFAECSLEKTLSLHQMTYLHAIWFHSVLRICFVVSEEESNVRVTSCVWKIESNVSSLFTNIISRHVWGAWHTSHNTGPVLSIRA